MFGYCSNSPIRCKNAHSMVVLDQVDACCPECGLSLVPVKSLGRQLKIDERILQLTFLVTALLLLFLVYIYYLNFV